ncbi:MAG TPA: hypothetical protein PK177_17045, partial [Burkholderiaceae bacterium]|nr:hypothetical protein [Burkholderiaceae bacterium]
MVQQVAGFLGEDVQQLGVEPADIQRLVRLLDGEHARQQCRHRGIGMGRCVHLDLHLVFGGGRFGFKAFGFEALSFDTLGFETFGFDAFGFETFGFAAFRFETFGFGTFGFEAPSFDTLGFKTLDFDAFGFETFCFKTFCFETFCFENLGFETFRFETFRFKTLGFKPFGFEAFGFGTISVGALGFEPLRFKAFGFGTLGFETLGFDTFGFDTLGFETFGFDTLGFDAFGFETFGFDTFGFETLGFDAFGFETFDFKAFGFGTFGFDAFGLGTLRFGFDRRCLVGRCGIAEAGVCTQVVGRQRDLVARHRCIDKVRILFQSLRIDQHRQAAGLREAVAQRDEPGRERIPGRQCGNRPLQDRDGVADHVRQFGDRGNALRRRGCTRREQAACIVFRRSQHAVDDRHFGHRERAVHRMQRAQQRVGALRVTGVRLRQPAVDRLQVPGHFGVEDLQQQRVDLRRHHGQRLAHFDEFDSGGILCGPRLCRKRRRRDLRRHGVVAGSDPVGRVLQDGKIGGDPAFAAQRRYQFGKRVERTIDHRDDRRTGGSLAVAHLVEHVLDLPAELAQRARTHQPAAALERMEHATDRRQSLEVVRFGAPGRQQPVEVVDLLRELLQEDLADLLVDFLANGFEAADHRSGPPGRWRRGCRRHLGGGRLARGHGRCFDPRLLDRRRNHRQRPVAQRFEAVARDVEDVVAIAALLTQRLEVVLEARERVGKRVQLAPVGHALATDQFVLGVAADRDQVIRRQRQFHHPQRAGDLVEQARHVGQLFMLPAGLDERHQRLAGLDEVGDRLANDRVDHLLGLAGEQVAAGNRAGGFAGPQPRHLVVEGRVHVEQRASDVQQCVLVRGDGAVEDRQHRVPLLLYHLARHAKAEHAERVGDARQRFGLRLQARQVVRTGAQVQVERVLDVQQVVLHRRRHRVEQGAIAAADTAAGVLELGR